MMGRLFFALKKGEEPIRKNCMEGIRWTHDCFTIYSRAVNMYGVERNRRSLLGGDALPEKCGLSKEDQHEKE